MYFVLGGGVMAAETHNLRAEHFRENLRNSNFDDEQVDALAKIFAQILDDERRRWEEVSKLMTQQDFGEGVGQLKEVLLQFEKNLAEKIANELKAGKQTQAAILQGQKEAREWIWEQIYDVLQQLATKDDLKQLSNEIRSWLLDLEKKVLENVSTKEDLRNLEDRLKELWDEKISKTHESLRNDISQSEKLYIVQNKKSMDRILGILIAIFVAAFLGALSVILSGFTGKQ